MKLRNLLCALLLLCPALSAATLAVFPAPLRGNDGLAGWGFTLVNDTNSYLSVDSVQLIDPVDDPAFRFGPAANFTELFATYQFSQPTILIAPNSTYSLAYDGGAQGLATWLFPDGYGTHGNLLSNVFRIEVGYSLYDDDAYNTPTLDEDVPVTGTLEADAQLQFVPEPGTWLMAAAALALLGARRRRLA